jgi:hypothetical protein
MEERNTEGGEQTQIQTQEGNSPQQRSNSAQTVLEVRALHALELLV